MRFVWSIFAMTLTGSLILWAAPQDVTFAYQGTLERNGVALEGNHALTFTLYDGTTALLPTFAFPAVPTARGQFSVELGPLTNTMLASQNLNIGVIVDGVTLEGRQRVHAVPFSMRGRGDGVFTVDNRLDVGGVTVGALDTSANTNKSISFAQNAGDESNAGKILYGGAFGTGRLHIVGGGPSPRKIRLWDDVEVGTVNGWQLGSGGVMQFGNNMVTTGPENLRIVRGTINGDADGTPTVSQGSGFSVSRSGARYAITFTPPFSGVPTLTCTANHPNTGYPTGGSAFCTALHPADQSASTVYAVLSDGAGAGRAWGLSFVAVGPR